MLILPAHLVHESHAAINRGRDASRRIRDDVQESRERGRPIVAVCVDEATAADMRQFFNFAFAQFDGVLPPIVNGARFAVGNTGGQPIVYSYETEH